MDKKTIGQILIDAEKTWQDSYEERGVYDPNWREPCSEFAATAVWNEAVEACIQAINNLDPQGSFRAGLNDSIAALRDLKRSDKENGDG